MSRSYAKSSVREISSAVYISSEEAHFTPHLNIKRCPQDGHWYFLQFTGNEIE